MFSYFQRVRSFSPDIKLVLLFCLLANIGYGVIELMFNFYLLELGYLEDFIGEWRAVATLAVAGASLGLGTMINRFGTWKSLVGGFGLLCVVSFGLGIVSNSWLLLLFAVGYGVSLAFLVNPVLPFIMDHERMDLRQYASAVALSVVSLSIMIGSLMGGALPNLVARVIPSIVPESANAYRATIFVGAAIAMFGMIPLFMMKEPRRFKPQRRDRKLQTAELKAEQRRSRIDILQFSLMGGLMSLGVGMVWPFYNILLKSLGSTDDQVGYIFALAALIGAVTSLVAPVVIAKTGALNSALALRLSVVPFFIPMIFMPTLGLAILGFYWRGATASTAWPIEVTFISEVLPPRERAGVFGVRSSTWNLGYAGATYVGGISIVRYGYTPAMVSFVIFSILSAVVYYAYFARHPAVVSGAVPSAWSPARRARLSSRASRLAANVAESEATVSSGS